MSRISKPEQRVLAEVQGSAMLQEIVGLEPDVQHILLVAALQGQERNRWQAYSALKKMFSELVEHDARTPALRSDGHYQAMLQAIDHLLPETPMETEQRHTEWMVEAWENADERMVN
jgi:hypothetical protein